VKRYDLIRNRMAIASGLIDHKVPALRHERASISGLEFEAAQS
jgi:hypothetical protein